MLVAFPFVIIFVLAFVLFGRNKASRIVGVGLLRLQLQQSMNVVLLIDPKLAERLYAKMSLFFGGLAADLVAGGFAVDVEFSSGERKFVHGSSGTKRPPDNYGDSSLLSAAVTPALLRHRCPQRKAYRSAQRRFVTLTPPGWESGDG